jgi:hypothetical protein
MNDNIIDFHGVSSQRVVSVPPEIPKLRAALAGEDPIFPMIDLHRELSAQYTAAADTYCRLRSSDPEYDDAQALTHETGAALIDQADLLIRSEPTTVAGVLALMRYAAGWEWHEKPADLEWDDEGPSWEQLFLTTLADRLEKIGGRAEA